MQTIVLAKQGVFHTVQGEGHLTGQPMTFVRLAGCSVGCPACDTDYRAAETVGVDALAERILESFPDDVRDRWVWITGGEPADQDLSPLVRRLHRAGIAVAVATSGVKRVVAPVDWLSVSPHGLLSQRYGNEVKIVPGLNGLDARSWIAQNDGTIDFWLRFLQPLHGDEKGLSECLALRERFPHWGLSLQAHKIWGLP